CQAGEGALSGFGAIMVTFGYGFFGFWRYGKFSKMPPFESGIRRREWSTHEEGMTPVPEGRRPGVGASALNLAECCARRRKRPFPARDDPARGGFVSRCPVPDS